MSENKITTSDLEKVIEKIFNEAAQEVNEITGGDFLGLFSGKKREERKKEEERKSKEERKEEERKKVEHTMEKKQKFEELLKTKFGDALVVLDKGKKELKDLFQNEDLRTKNIYSFVLVEKGEPYLHEIDAEYNEVNEYKFKYFLGDFKVIYNNDERAGKDDKFIIEFIRPTDDRVKTLFFEHIKNYTIYRIDKTHPDAKAAVDEEQNGGKRKKTRNNKKKSSKKSRKSKKKNTKKNKTRKNK